VQKKYLSSKLLLVLLLLLGATGAAAELKIAVLDTQRALLESEEARQLLQTAQSELEKVNDRRQELLQQMVPKIDAVLKDLIELEGYDLIMERANLRYANSKHDITRRVTEKLNERRDSAR